MNARLLRELPSTLPGGMTLLETLITEIDHYSRREIGPPTCGQAADWAQRLTQFQDELLAALQRESQP